MAKIKRISEIAPLSEVQTPISKPEQFMGKELILHEVEHKEGDLGPYVLMTVSDPTTESQEPFLVSCGGEVVRKQIAIAEQSGLPVSITFRKSGRQIYME